MKIRPFQLEEYYAKYEFNTKYLLSSSDCDSYTVKEILDMEPGAHDEFMNHWLGYTEAPGSTKLREEITKLYEDIKPEDLLVHSGAEEAIFNFMNCALEPGDHIIVQFPAYQSLYEIAKSIGTEVTNWEIKEEDAWQLDIDFLKNNIKPNTKAIILNCPHNPTGAMIPQDQFKEIIEIARKHNLYIFSDEVYRYLEYDPSDRLPAAADLYEKAVSLGVMSKSFGLAGIRIGWVASKDSELLEKMASFKHYLTICNSAPSEFIAITALKNKEKILSNNLSIIQSNLKLLDDFFTKHQDVFNWQRPKAGCIAFPSLKPDIDSEDFCVDLIKTKGVLLLPSAYYGAGNKNFRVGFSRRNMPEALKELGSYIEKDLLVK